jgi:quercetin dioxygenase-like cupin family protein
MDKYLVDSEDPAMLTAAADAPRHETPNAVMRTLAAPSLGACELSVWEVAMRAGQRGPAHAVDREQVWTVLDGELRVEAGGEALTVGAGDALRLAAGVLRQIAAIGDTRALVASGPGPNVTTPDGGTRPLPWAA